MYDKTKIVMDEVIHVDQVEELHKSMMSCDMSQSVFANKTPTIEFLSDFILQDKIYFINVYYEKALTGYIVLECRSSKTVDFHWGLIKKNKYLPAIIKDCFNKCCESPIETFIGWTPSNNKIAIKVAKKMGFEVMNEIPNYYNDGGSTTLSIYKNEVNNG
jgi:hypothetical protein